MLRLLCSLLIFIGLAAAALGLYVLTDARWARPLTVLGLALFAAGLGTFASTILFLTDG